MDVETAVTLAAAAGTAVGSGAASAVGESAWQSVVQLARRATGRGAPGTADPGTTDPGMTDPGTAAAGAPGGRDGVDPADPAAVRDFAALLRQRAAQDGDFAAQLCAWAERNRVTIEATRHRDDSVENEITGSRISGNVVQARDIHGGITFN